MNDTQLQNAIDEQMKTLPQDVKDAVFSVDYSTALDQVTKKNKLLIDQAGKLETETTLVMVGLESLADYKKNLMTNMEVDERVANTIAMDVDDLIFKKIRESLQKMNEETGEENLLEEPEMTRATILEGIENPSEIHKKEGSIYFSSLNSNSGEKTKEIEDMGEGVEIQTPMNNYISETKQISPNPKPILLATNSLSDNPEKKVEDVIVEKMGGMTSMPKERVVIEETSKIPLKPEPKKDPYREPIE
ncbi:MAG: hypothetical protein WCC74_01415 [Minisyncoccia bacterium]